MTSPARPSRVPVQVGADAQPNLFDPDDAALDAPVPYTLTVAGRRAVDDVPPLRVVTDDRDTVEPAADDDRFRADLEHTDTWRQARVRAMARAGHEPAEIARESDLSESVVRLWLAEVDVPADVGPGREPVGAATTPARAEPSSPRSRGPTTAAQDPAVADARGRAILATCGTVEIGAVVATTSRIAVAAELVTWLRTHHDVGDGSIRVVLRVADRATADLVARAWADRLGLTPDRVSTVAWSRAPTPRAVQAMVRATGRDLAARLGRVLGTWPS